MSYEDLMTLVSEYGAARSSQGFRIGTGDSTWAASAQHEAAGLYDRIATVVYRLYRDRGEEI